MAFKKSELASMTKDELVKLAKKEKIEISASLKKDEIIDKLVSSSKKAPDAKPKAAASAKPSAKKSTAGKSAAAAVKSAGAGKAAAKAKTVKKAAEKAAPAAKKAPAKKPVTPAMNDTMAGESKKFEIDDRRGYYVPTYEQKGEAAYELPAEYGDTRITLLVQDPYWLHAYWEINSDDRRKFSVMPDGKLTVRITNAQTNEYFDVSVNAGSRSWYFNVPQVNKPYYSEIGITLNGAFKSIARSNMVMTPSDKAAPASPDVHWRMASSEVAEEIFRKSGGYMIHKLVGSQMVSEWIAAPAAGASGVAGSAPLSSAGWSGVMSSGSGGMNVQQAPSRKRGFWAELHTELIVYGATEPDAKVTVGGVPMKLTPSGTFSVRFYLKDGDHPVPFIATSSDEIDTIEITPFVSKRTERKEYKNK